MSLLDTLPHRCTVRRKTVTRGTIGTKTGWETVSEDVECWEQPAGAREIEFAMKRGLNIDRKVYFASDPQLTNRYQIVITEREGVTVSGEPALDVIQYQLPDVSAGTGNLYRVLCRQSDGSDD